MMALRNLACLRLIAGPLVTVAAGVTVASETGRQPGAHGAVLDAAGLLLVVYPAVPTGLSWWLLASRREQLARLASVSEELSRILRREQDLIECSSDLIWEIDAGGRFTSVSDHNNVMGHDWGIRVGLSVGELAELDPVTPREVWTRQIASNMAGEPFRDFHYCLRRPDGRIASFFVNGVPIRSQAGALIGFRGITRDRTIEVETLNVLRFQVSHDVLTGLLNRRGLTTALQAAAIAGRQFAVLLLDLDGFKTINDVHGHAAGDQLLRLVAARLDRLKRSGDTVCRLGGDEFAVVLAEADRTTATEVASSLVNSLRAPFLLDDEIRARVGASIGIALASPQGANHDLILRHADLALYESKHSGGNRISLYGEAEEFRTIDEPPAEPLDGVVQHGRALAALPGRLGQPLTEERVSPLL